MSFESFARRWPPHLRGRRHCEAVSCKLQQFNVWEARSFELLCLVTFAVFTANGAESLSFVLARYSTTRWKGYIIHELLWRSEAWLFFRRVFCQGFEFLVMVSVSHLTHTHKSCFAQISKPCGRISYNHMCSQIANGPNKCVAQNWHGLLCRTCPSPSLYNRLHDASDYHLGNWKTLQQ